jgi:hypothetical protein
MEQSLPQLILPIKLERSPERLGLQVLKRRVLPASYRTATVATLRWKVYRVAGKLERHARGWMLQIKADLEKWLLLQSARLCCARLRS